MGKLLILYGQIVESVFSQIFLELLSVFSVLFVDVWHFLSNVNSKWLPLLVK